jgi:hypothetical protein
MDQAVPRASSMRRMLLIAALGLSTVLFEGCSSSTPGQAQPSSTAAIATGTATESATPSGSDTSQAPKVTHPLNASNLAANPCSGLTTTDIAGLRVTNPIIKAKSDVAGSQCTWTGDSPGSLSVGWVTPNTNGLSNLYAKSDTIAYWQPTTVAGYPAAYGDVISDGRAQGDCVINVAVNDHLYFDSEFTNPLNAGQSCALAEQAAADVIKNLGGS